MKGSSVLICMLAAAACAGPGGSSPRPDQTLISQAEIVEAGTTDAYQLVQRLRPMWLQIRGRTSVSDVEQDVVVYVDGTRFGFSEELRRLQTDNIESIRYLNAQRAQNRFGVGHVNGAILVTMKQ